MNNEKEKVLTDIIKELDLYNGITLNTKCKFYCSDNQFLKYRIKQKNNIIHVFVLLTADKCYKHESIYSLMNKKGLRYFEHIVLDKNNSYFGHKAWNQFREELLN